MKELKDKYYRPMAKKIQQMPSGAGIAMIRADGKNLYFSCFIERIKGQRTCVKVRECFVDNKEKSVNIKKLIDWVN